MQKSHSGRETFEFYLDKSRVMYDSNLSLSFQRRNQSAPLYIQRKTFLDISDLCFKPIFTCIFYRGFIFRSILHPLREVYCKDSSLLQDVILILMLFLMNKIIFLQHSFGANHKRDSNLSRPQRMVNAKVIWNSKNLNFSNPIF